MGNIIDIRSRLKSNTDTQIGGKVQAEVHDITVLRQDVLTEERRRVKRTILTEFISVHTVLPGLGLMKVMLDNIDSNGMAFDIPETRGHFSVGEEVAMRVYLNHQTYFSFIVRVRHVTPVEDEGVFRHGVEYVKGTVNDVALNHFVQFIETVSASLKSDHGDVVVSKITLT
jgi:hypothetical protein